MTQEWSLSWSKTRPLQRCQFDSTATPGYLRLPRRSFLTPSSDRTQSYALNTHLHCFGYVGEGVGLDVGIGTGPYVVEVLAQDLSVGAGRCDV
jgi:hypothetical protein